MNEKQLQKLEETIEFWRNKTDDPHGIAMAVYCALLEVKNIFAEDEEIEETVYVCKNCEAIYLEIVSQCDCQVGENFKYYIGKLTYHKDDTSPSKELS